MRGKRSKQYRKLIQQYGIAFGFREPYQVLLDADTIKDASRFTMDLVHNLEKALHGRVKPLITQCCMRHLYVSEPRVPELVELAQTFERRRCNHHTLKEPLTALECLKGVVDPKGSGTNRNRYVVASQSLDVRAAMRRIPGVPLIYLNRSVMILEPMARITEDARERSEKGKFRAMLKDKRAGPDASKRKTASVATIGVTLEGTIDGIKPSTAQDEATAKKRKRGPKGPNPLSVKKPRKRVRDEALEAQHQPADDASEAPRKRKRRRKHGPAGRGQEGQETS